MTEKEEFPCSRCDGTMEFKKSWKLKGKGEHELWMKLYKCESCGATLRFPSIEKRGGDT